MITALSFDYLFANVNWPNYCESRVYCTILRLETRDTSNDNDKINKLVIASPHFKYLLCLQSSRGQSIMYQYGYWDKVFSQDQIYSLEILPLQKCCEIWMCRHSLQIDRWSIGWYLNEDIVKKIIFTLRYMLFVWGYTKYSVTNKMNSSLQDSVIIHIQEPNVIAFPIIQCVFSDVFQESHPCTSKCRAYESLLNMRTPLVDHKMSSLFWQSHVDINIHCSTSILTGVLWGYVGLYHLCLDTKLASSTIGIRDFTRPLWCSSRVIFIPMEPMFLEYHLMEPTSYIFSTSWSWYVLRCLTAIRLTRLVDKSCPPNLQHKIRYIIISIYMEVSWVEPWGGTKMGWMLVRRYFGVISSWISHTWDHIYIPFGA